MIKKRVIQIAVIMIAGVCFGFEYEPYWPGTKIIDEDWQYLQQDTEAIPSSGAYQPVTLPHTWNAEDTLRARTYRRAGSWYRKALEVTPAQLKERLYLRFGAAGQEARVYLNGEPLTHHVGGYSAFTVELTGKVRAGDNRVDVWVSNAHKEYIIPQNGDFNFYGGIYRPVQLVEAPQISISRKLFGGPGYRVWSEKVSSRKADLQVRVQLDNGSDHAANLAVEARVRDADNQIVAEKMVAVAVGAGAVVPVDLKLPPVKKPHLWSPENPELYRIEIAVLQDGKELDRVAVNHGFRSYEFTADKGFFLNGKPYKLHGTSRHQDFDKEGNALARERHLTDLKLMKEAGINWLRLAHYQQDDYVLQLCDQLGILVWEEVPFVNSGKPELIDATIHSMMKDMIEQHFNHPAIILWGLGNEVHLKQRPDGKAVEYDLLKRLNERVHQEDPVRKTVYVNRDRNDASEWGIVSIPDVFAYNLYRGWYGDEGLSSLTARLNELHAMDPEKPLILSEFGAGSDLAVHEEHPKEQDFSVEYQNIFLESHLDQLAAMDWLCGANWWAFADFGSAVRGDSIPHVNQKGLVTFDRQRKDVFYLLKSRWSTEPVVYIESPFWTERGGAPEKTYRVFTNLDEVEFFHNGKSLGRQSAGFRWNVTLEDGENTLRAIGTRGKEIQEHAFTVTYGKFLERSIARATDELKDYPAANLVDGDPSTRWAAAGDQNIHLDLRKISLIDGIQIQINNGANKKYKLQIAGHPGVWKAPIVLFDGESELTDELQTFRFKEQQEMRYFQIKVHGLRATDKVSFSEIIPMVTLEKHKKNIYETMGTGG